MDAGDLPMLDIILVPFSVACFLLYHFYLYLCVRFSPLRTVIGFNHITRQQWVENVMEEGKDILAVQSLRNHLMAGTLLASSCILLASTMAGFAASSDKWIGLELLQLKVDDTMAPSQPVNFPSSDHQVMSHPKETILGGTKEQSLRPFKTSSAQRDTSSVASNSTTTTDIPSSNPLLVIKFFALIVTFLAAFFCYTQHIRLYNHVNFLINIPATRAGPSSVPYVVSVMARGSNFYTIGTRISYLGMLFLIWLFGPIWMFSMTMLFLFLIFFLDRCSSEEEKMAIISSTQSTLPYVDDLDANATHPDSQKQSIIEMYPTNLTKVNGQVDDALSSYCIVTQP